ncbi:MAG: hypothetical protein KGL18_16695 [Burkholderiales bacterium]|nr:hypothetical protein [Burkholderiales bacterium]MDE1926819.1 hypothetical protein [Burkholderiales bacterium]MDE2160522.1 hypothetical protein [Burkholderiales bacterium]MDE2504604.1 hypothetical protein [Burkholderiales bacterium]
MTGPHFRRWQRPAIHGCGSLLLASGMAWLLLHYGSSADLPAPAEAWLMKLHGLASFAAFFVFGMLAASHLAPGWRATARPRGRAQRRLGLMLCLLAALMMASACALDYFAPENARPALGIAHSVVGAAMALVLWLHRRSARRFHPRT